VITVAGYNISEGCKNPLKDFEDGMRKDGSIVESGESVTVESCDRTNDCEFFDLTSEDEDSDIE
jgi:hypothetical protein